jgi:monoamine oxidase
MSQSPSVAQTKELKRVGIVGAGMAGLYAAYRLQLSNDPHIAVSLYELDGRVGGRVKTHRFTSEKDQYFEAGAMRIPSTQMHQPTFDLIKLLNDTYHADLKLIPYHLTTPGNRIFINGILKNGGDDSTAKALGFDLPVPYDQKTADALLLSAIQAFIDLLEKDFDQGWKLLLRLDKVPFRSYLEALGWPQSVIDFTETMCSQTNQFALSFSELIMQNLDFDTKQWFTLDEGMDRLPQALAGVVGIENITFGARVQKIEETGDGVTICADTPKGRIEQTFDKVILAIPPSALKMIPERPRWDFRKEQAIRAMFYEALYKIGLRFKTRFWEHVQPPSLGGQSTTDLPIRWIVYPSNGIGSEGPGVLLLYSWNTDASVWSSIPFSERLKSSLCHLSKVFPSVDVYDQFIAAEDLAWSEHNPTGDAMFLPGQLSEYFEIARRKEGNIYFAGEHLSRHHTWITGAIDSARSTAQEVISDFAFKRIPTGWIPPTGTEPSDHYDPEACRMKVIKGGLENIKNNREEFEKSVLLNAVNHKH